MQAATDEELAEWQDDIATTRGTAHDYYLGELRARQAARAIAASELLARRAYWLTVANTLVAVVAVIVAVIAILAAQR